LVAAFVAGSALLGTWVDWLWFGSVGYRGVDEAPAGLPRRPSSGCPTADRADWDSPDWAR
jgi:hypothetical protein